jgi:putative membrane protein
MTSATATPGEPALHEGAAVELPWQRLSIRMLLVHPVMELIRYIPFILIILVAGSASGGHPSYWGLTGLAIAVVLGLARWATTKYRVTPTQVEVRRGILGKSVLTVPRDRVRSVDMTSHFMHRLLGLTRLTIGTGQTDRKNDKGLVLDGLSAQDGAQLRADLLRKARAATGTAGTGPAAVANVAGTTVADTTVDGAPVAGGPGGLAADGTFASTPPVGVAQWGVDEPAATVVAKLDPAWVRYGPFTLSGLATIGVVAAFGWRLINEAQVDPDKVGVVQTATNQLAGLPVTVAVLEIAVALALVVALFSTVGYVLAYWNFTLTRSGFGTLHVSRGLITTRSTTIEERRLRGVEYSEPLLLRAVGAARAIAITTGLRVGRGAERGGSVLLPPAPAAEVRRVAADVLGDSVPLTVELTRHPRAALRRRLTRVLVAWVILLGLAGLLDWWLDAPMWTAGLTLIALPLLILLAIDRYRSLGHSIVDGRVVFRQGSLVRRRMMIDGAGVVGWNIKQSFFQRRSKLVTLTATTAAGRQGYELPDVDGATAAAIADEVLPNLITPFLVPAPAR